MEDLISYNQHGRHLVIEDLKNVAVSIQTVCGATAA